MEVNIVSYYFNEFNIYTSRFECECKMCRTLPKCTHLTGYYFHSTDYFCVLILYFNKEAYSQTKISDSTLKTELQLNRRYKW